jgi:hypothetical protein
MKAIQPMEDLQLQESSGHVGVEEVSQSHGQSVLATPTVNIKTQIKIIIWNDKMMVSNLLVKNYGPLKHDAM